MKNVRILYATKTRHSKKLADAIGEALGVSAENVTARPRLSDVDLLFIVGGIYGGESLPSLLDYVRTLDSASVRRAALVTSCASKKNRQDSVRKLLEEKGIAVADEWICQGSFLFMGLGHPNAAELSEAARFALGLVKKEGSAS